ncbi:MFS transporter [Streptomyces tagetis]|uniref:MFS transporter n=1 Tax=Streptomyces tagetis TaxID=2820809 RepID=A0A940XIF7_9ACTN|nr:MFS transporter [Streptomyces sp. RG38]MBQ0828975.1 MFS transporter [Streptomyces sp. RG38]
MPRPTPERPVPQYVLPAVTADTLVLADFRPRGRDRPPGPYRRLLSVPGARAFTAGSLLARLPMGMFGVSAVLMIAARYGSYALAGAVTATGLAVTALVAPGVARLVDRHGQARVAVPAALLAALGSLALVLCVRAGAPAWTLFAAYAATASAPNTGGMARARWARLVGGDAAALHSAHSFEQAADELCFMLGPVLAAFLCTAWFPEAGTVAGVVLLVAGMLLFTAQRATEPPPVPHTPARAPLRSPGMPALLAVCVAMGAVFGAMEVVTVAFADERGHRAAAGVALGLQAAGSCAAGLAFGALRLPGPAAARLPWCVAAMTALMTLPFLAATSGSLLLVSMALFVAGTATAPTMVTTMTLVQRRAPEGRLNESMTLAVTGLLTGIALGSATGGWSADHAPPAMGYALPATAAALALLLTLTGVSGRVGARPSG